MRCFGWNLGNYAHRPALESHTVINSTSPLRLCDYATMRLIYIMSLTIHRKCRTPFKSYKVLESHCYTIAWPCNTATILRLKKIILLAPCDSATMRLIYLISLTIHRKRRTPFKSYRVLESRCYTIAWPCDTATMLRLKMIICLAYQIRTITINDVPGVNYITDDTP